jgi:hypothetical protein
MTTYFNPSFQLSKMTDGKDNCTSHRLQQKLERHFGNLITMQPQQGQGMSNLIHSSTISTPESIGAATRITTQMVNWDISPTVFTTRYSPHVYPQLFCVLHIWKVEHTKNHTICNTNPKWKEVNLFLLTDTMHSAKDKHFRSFPIVTEVLSLADSKAESSSFQHVFGNC